jgi:hypothetical protein
VIFRRDQSLVHFYLFLILMTFRGLSSIAAGFIFMQVICRFITVLVFWIYKGVMMRSTWICSRYMSGQWATAHGLKLNPEKSQVILIHRCKADIPKESWV